MSEVRKLQVHHSQFDLSEFRTKEFFYKVPVEHEYADILRPEYWAHIANRVAVPGEKTLGYKIIAHREDSAWRAELAIVGVTQSTVTLKEISFVDWREQAEESDESPYKVGYVRGGWRAVRKSDSEIVVKGCASREEAEKALADHLNQVTA